jgi:hypothetical protein
MPREDYLFVGRDWHSVAQSQRTKMLKEIEAIDPDRLLNTSVEDLVSYFETKYCIEVPTLNVKELMVDQREKSIDVSRDPMRMIFDRSRPSIVAGTEIEVELPFAGQGDVFAIQPSSFTLNPPLARVSGDKLVFSIVGTNLEGPAVRARIDETVRLIESYLDTLRADVTVYNGQVAGTARNAIEARRTKLLANSSLAASLGFKMKERGGEARTYVAPEIRRRLVPVMPAASTAPFKPEPSLSVDDYEHILQVMQNMVHVMERSPAAFESMDEEALRTHFLVQLNGHYEGQATGETFNYEGKTDILIRSEGRNIFIAECKVWSGPKMLAETIDQLLSYSSWRDTKTAVVVFNRNRDFSRVLAAIPEAARSHPQYKRDLPGSTETVLRYCFGHRDDANRELQLTVLAFDVPTARKEV